jgi:methyl-accepting chemotaxis protein
MLFNRFGSNANEVEAAKQAVAAAEQKASIADLVPAPVMAVDRDFKITYVNRAAAEVAARSVDDCVGAYCFELFKTEHCRTSECRCAQAMDSGTLSVGETVARPAGLEIPIRYTASPLRAADGTITGALEFILDISEETQVSEAVSAIASQALEGFLDERADTAGLSGNNAEVISGLNQVLDSLVGHMDAMPSPALIVDKDFSVRFINEAAATVAGVPAEQAKGRKCYELFQAGDCKTNACALGRANGPRSAPPSAARACPSSSKGRFLDAVARGWSRRARVTSIS